MWHKEAAVYLKQVSRSVVTTKMVHLHPCSRPTPCPAPSRRCPPTGALLHCSKHDARTHPPLSVCSLAVRMPVFHLCLFLIQHKLLQSSHSRCYLLMAHPSRLCVAAHMMCMHLLFVAGGQPIITQRAAHPNPDARKCVVFIISWEGTCLGLVVAASVVTPLCWQNAFVIVWQVLSHVTYPPPPCVHAYCMLSTTAHDRLCSAPTRIIHSIDSTVSIAVARALVPQGTSILVGSMSQLPAGAAH